jgi:hypothetical protein
MQQQHEGFIDRLHFSPGRDDSGQPDGFGRDQRKRSVV